MTKAGSWLRFSPLRRRWTSFPVVVMLCLVMGLHWTLFRTVGWVRMFVTFAQTDAVGEALTKTFDGLHPCKVCDLVKQAKQSEKKHSALKTEAKLDLWLAVGQTELFPPSDFCLLPLWANSASDRNESPPVPPPRATATI